MIFHSPFSLRSVNMSVKRDPDQLSISSRTVAIVPTTSIAAICDLIPAAGPASSVPIEQDRNWPGIELRSGKSENGRIPVESAGHLASLSGFGAIDIMLKDAGNGFIVLEVCRSDAHGIAPLRVGQRVPSVETSVISGRSRDDWRLILRNFRHINVINCSPNPTERRRNDERGF